jgi:hypothetical protein
MPSTIPPVSQFFRLIDLPRAPTMIGARAADDLVGDPGLIPSRFIAGRAAS